MPSDRINVGADLLRWLSAQSLDWFEADRQRTRSVYMQETTKKSRIFICQILTGRPSHIGVGGTRHCIYSCFCILRSPMSTL